MYWPVVLNFAVPLDLFFFALPVNEVFKGKCRFLHSRTGEVMRKSSSIVKPKQLGHLVLRVRDLSRSEAFYTEILGLDVTAKIPNVMVFLGASSDSSHELALMSVGSDALGPEEDRVGLYHFAWRMGSMSEMRQIYRHLEHNEVNILGTGDHGISLGVYFLDPDGNKVEVYYELPRDKWPDGDLCQEC